MESSTESFLLRSFPLKEVPLDLLRESLTLSNLIWPVKESLDERIENLLKKREENPESRHDEAWHLISEGGTVIARATTFTRVIATASGSRFRILALAGVCSHPDHRGKGLARRVVQAGWTRLDSSMPLSFFQTDVPAFYEPLGARIVANRVYNSADAKVAFSYSHAMIFPGNAAWPDESIDLLGPGW